MAAFDLHLSDAHDVYLDETGNLALVTGPDLVAQRLDISLNTHLGEWLLDTSFGVDYRGQILVKNPDFTVIRSVFADVITGTDGVSDLLQLDLDTDDQRGLLVDFRVLTTDADILEAEGGLVPVEQELISESLSSVMLLLLFNTRKAPIARGFM
jgi:hypothetical protein